MLPEIRTITRPPASARLRPMLDRPERVVRAWRRCVEPAAWYHADREQAVAFALDVKNRALGFTLVSLGTVTSTAVEAREVFRSAIVLGATAVIFAHNHPSGDPSPSAADRALTRDLLQAGSILGLHLIDHVIVTASSRHYSFRARGWR